MTLQDLLNMLPRNKSDRGARTRALAFARDYLQGPPLQHFYHSAKWFSPDFDRDQLAILKSIGVKLGVAYPGPVVAYGGRGPVSLGQYGGDWGAAEVGYGGGAGFGFNGDMGAGDPMGGGYGGPYGGWSGGAEGWGTDYGAQGGGGWGGPDVTAGQWGAGGGGWGGTAPTNPNYWPGNPPAGAGPAVGSILQGIGSIIGAATQPGAYTPPGGLVPGMPPPGGAGPAYPPGYSPTMPTPTYPAGYPPGYPTPTQPGAYPPGYPTPTQPGAYPPGYQPTQPGAYPPGYPTPTTPTKEGGGALWVIGGALLLLGLMARPSRNGQRRPRRRATRRAA